MVLNQCKLDCGVNCAVTFGQDSKRYFKKYPLEFLDTEAPFRECVAVCMKKKAANFTSGCFEIEEIEKDHHYHSELPDWDELYKNKPEPKGREEFRMPPRPAPEFFVR